MIMRIMNKLYANEWSQYRNYFRPNTKLISKIRMNAKYRKIYQTPSTPYLKLMASEQINSEAKIKLATQYNKLDPFELKKQIEAQMKAIFKYIP